MTEMGAQTAAARARRWNSRRRRRSTPSAPLRERWIGVAIVVGTLVKVVFEAPWDLAPRPSEALGISVAPSRTPAASWPACWRGAQPA